MIQVWHTCDIPGIDPTACVGCDFLVSVGRPRRPPAQKPGCGLEQFLRTAGAQNTGQSAIQRPTTTYTTYGKLSKDR